MIFASGAVMVSLVFIQKEIEMNIYNEQIMARIELLQEQAIELHNNWTRLDPVTSRDDYEAFLWCCVAMGDLPDLIGSECLLLSGTPQSGDWPIYGENIRMAVLALAKEMRVA